MCNVKINNFVKRVSKSESMNRKFVWYNQVSPFYAYTVLAYVFFFWRKKNNLKWILLAFINNNAYIWNVHHVHVCHLFVSFFNRLFFKVIDTISYKYDKAIDIPKDKTRILRQVAYISLNHMADKESQSSSRLRWTKNYWRYITNFNFNCQCLIFIYLWSEHYK
jgi:hypothetical protein